MKDELLKLTNAVYKLLEFFPESDPLKNKAKDKVLAIMENLVLISESGDWLSFKDYFSAGSEKVKIQISQDIDILLGYFGVGKSQGWLSGINCFIICNEYEKIKKQVGLKPGLVQKISDESKVKSQELKVDENDGKPDKSPEGHFDGPASIPASNASHSFGRVLGGESKEVTARQRKILEFLSKNEKTQVMDLQTILPDVTKRTIRRDLDELLKLGKLTRLGEFNQVFYRISQKNAEFDRTNIFR